MGVTLFLYHISFVVFLLFLSGVSVGIVEPWDSLSGCVGKLTGSGAPLLAILVCQQIHILARVIIGLVTSCYGQSTEVEQGGTNGNVGLTAIPHLHGPHTT